MPVVILSSSVTTWDRLPLPADPTSQRFDTATGFVWRGGGQLPAIFIAARAAGYRPSEKFNGIRMTPFSGEERQIFTRRTGCRVLSDRRHWLSCAVPLDRLAPSPLRLLPGLILVNRGLHGDA